MNQERFNQIWREHITPAEAEAKYVDNGSSRKLIAAIISAGERGESLALNDWTEADY